MTTVAWIQNPAGTEGCAIRGDGDVHPDKVICRGVVSGSMDRLSSNPYLLWLPRVLSRQ